MATDGYRIALLELTEAEGDRIEYEAVLETALADLAADPPTLLLAVVLALNDERLDDARRLADRLDEARDSVYVPPWERAGASALVELQRNGDVDGVRAWLETAPLTFGKSWLLLTSLSDILDAGLGPQVLAVLENDPGRCCSERVMDGLAAELRGELDTAEQVYAEIADSGDARSVITLAEVDLGRARVARARGEDDRPYLASAARRLGRWPGRLRDRVEAMLGEPCAEPTEPGILTPREEEVARLVTQGLTNGGIADELFISTKTASVHVSHILSKLAMTSRSEIAAWVASGGLDVRD